MIEFKTLTARAAALYEVNIDTDQICPKQHLRVIRRVGFGSALFSDQRWNADGSLNRDFVLNQPAFAEAGILIGGENFGCGSSREHAVWAMVDYGIRCVIAPSFGDIFFQNSVNNGLLAIKMPKGVVGHLAYLAKSCAGTPWTVDLVNQSIALPDGDVVAFEIDAERKERLMLGLDEIALTLRYLPEIERFQTSQRAKEPWLWSAGDGGLAYRLTGGLQ